MSGFTKGETNAKSFGDLFDLNDLTAGIGSFDGTSTTDVITHGLTGTPDFVILTAEASVGPVTYTINSTALTVTRTGATASTETFSYIIGDLS